MATEGQTRDDKLKEDVSNNLLEFLIMAISIWLSLIKSKEMNVTNEMILILGNNTYAISWIFMSGLNTKSICWNVVLFIARKIAELAIESKHFIDSQHLPGVLNFMSDWLSFIGTSQIENKKAKKNLSFMIVLLMMLSLTVYCLLFLSLFQQVFGSFPFQKKYSFLCVKCF